MTRLANAETFRRHYDRSIQHAARSAEPLSLLMIDVDQLKGLNDELGTPSAAPCCDTWRRSWRSPSASAISPPDGEVTSSRC